MSNVIELPINNALQIPDEIIFDEKVDIANVIDKALTDSGFDRFSPIWFFSATIDDKNNIDNIWEGNPLEVIGSFFDMRAQGYDDVKLFIAQKRI